MRVRTPRPLRLLVPVLGLILALAGCDSVAPVERGAGSSSDLSSALLTETNDLDTRMSRGQKSAGAARLKAPESSSVNGMETVALASVTRIAPPRDTMRVRTLTHAGGTVYIGYDTPGPAFGGGIDRLDASDPTTLLAPNGLRGDAVDVEDVAQGSEDGALYVAGGLRPSAYDGDLRGTPASLLAVNEGEAPQVSVAGLAGTGRTSVAGAPESDDEHEVYAVSGGEALSEFGEALDDRTRRTMSGAALASVDATPTALLVAGRSGGVYSSEVETEDSFAQIFDLGDGRQDQRRARTGAALDGERLVLAPDAGGVTVLDATSGDVLARREGPAYTSISVHEDDPEVSGEPTGLVYAVRPEGRLDVYRVDEGGPDTGGSDPALRAVGTLHLRELTGAVSPVRRVMGVGCHVYAAGREGVAVMAVGTTQGCGAGGHRLPTAADDSAETTEREATTTAVLANDADPDGSLDASTVQVRRTPAHGTVRVDESTGEVTYTPEPGFTGTDEYTYTVADQDGWTSGETTVTIAVTALRPPPPPGG